MVSGAKQEIIRHMETTVEGVCGQGKYRNIEIMEKSGNNFFKLLKSGRGLENSFSAYLRGLNFEMSGKAHPQTPLKFLDLL